MADLVNVNTLGSAKGSAVEDAVNANFQGETAETHLQALKKLAEN